MSFYMLTWNQIAISLRGSAPGAIMRVEKHQVPHPRDAGMTMSLGLPLGQTTDFRMPFPNCGGLHVRDFGTHYEAHLDQRNPHCDPVGHAVVDTPAVAGAVALGALAGIALGRSKESLFVGAAIGGVLGLLVATSEEQKRQRMA